MMSFYQLRKFYGGWAGNYHYIKSGIKCHIYAEGKSEKHAKTMLIKRLKKLGINYE